MQAKHADVCSGCLFWTACTSRPHVLSLPSRREKSDSWRQAGSVKTVKKSWTVCCHVTLNCVQWRRMQAKVEFSLHVFQYTRFHSVAVISCCRRNYFFNTIDMWDRGRTITHIQIPGFHNQVWLHLRRLSRQHLHMIGIVVVDISVRHIFVAMVAMHWRKKYGIIFIEQSFLQVRAIRSLKCCSFSNQ